MGRVLPGEASESEGYRGVVDAETDGGAVFGEYEADGGYRDEVRGGVHQAVRAGWVDSQRCFTPLPSASPAFTTPDPSNMETTPFPPCHTPVQPLPCRRRRLHHRPYEEVRGDGLGLLGGRR